MCTVYKRYLENVAVVTAPNEGHFAECLRKRKEPFLKTQWLCVSYGIWWQNAYVHLWQKLCFFYAAVKDKHGETWNCLTQWSEKRQLDDVTFPRRQLNSCGSVYTHFWCRATRPWRFKSCGVWRVEWGADCLTSITFLMTWGTLKQHSCENRKFCITATIRIVEHCQLEGKEVHFEKMFLLPLPLLTF